MNTQLGRVQQNLLSSGQYAQNTQGPVQAFQALQNTPFGAMSLANRAATPVGRSTMDPARIAGMISRGTASKNKIAGATFMQNLQDSMIGRQLNERQMRMREQSVAEERRRYDLEQKQKQDELAKREQFRKAQLDVMRGTMTPPSGVQLPSTQTPSSSLSGTTGDAAAMGKQALGIMSPSLSNLQPEPGMPANPLPGLPAPLPGSPALPAAAMKPSGLDTIQMPTALPGTQSAGLSGTSLPASPTAPGLSEEESLKKAHEAYKASGYTDNSVFQDHFNRFPSRAVQLGREEEKIWQKMGENVNNDLMALDSAQFARESRDRFNLFPRTPFTTGANYRWWEEFNKNTMAKDLSPNLSTDENQKLMLRANELNRQAQEARKR